MHIDWSWVISAVIAAIISSLIRSSKGRETSARLAALENEVRALREHLGITAPPLTKTPSVTTIAPPSMTSPGIESLIHQGKKIEAIKVYREQAGVGLKEAKEAVEAIERRIKYGV